MTSADFDPVESFLTILLVTGPSFCPLTTPTKHVRELLNMGLIARSGWERTGQGMKPAYRISNRKAAKEFLKNRQSNLFSELCSDESES